MAKSRIFENPDLDFLMNQILQMYFHNFMNSKKLNISLHILAVFFGHKVFQYSHGTL